MILVALADIHDDLDRLPLAAPDLEAADLVLLAGDLTGFGGRRQATRVLEAVRRHNPRVLAVAGNCDRPEVDDLLTGAGINLHARSVPFDDLTLIGLGGSLPCPARTPLEYSEAQLDGFLQQAAAGAPDDRPLVLLSHQPPFRTAVDRVLDGRHVGSRSVRAFIEAHQPALCLTGHIHEGRGRDRLGRTSIINPGPLREGGYACVRVEAGRVTAEIRRAEIRR